jgi:polyhydroxyalkanoate synthesis regulator phasin
MSREKAEEIGKKVATEARLSETEGKQFIDELLKRAEETRSSFEKIIAQQVNTALQKIHIPTSSQVEALEQRVRKLEAMVKQESE